MVSTNDEVLNEAPVAQMVPVAGEIRNITEEDFEKAQKNISVR